MIFALVLFLVTYALLLVFSKHRAVIALASAFVFVVSGTLPVSKAFAAVDLNVIMMLAGTMGIVAMFIESKMPALLADLLLRRVPNVKWAIILLALFAGIISAFVDNVATVLMVAPVALTISKKIGISPVPGLIAIAISSNLQGAATLVGDTTAIMLGSHAKLTFFDFFFYQNKVSLFWVVQAGALAFMLVCMVLFRKYNQPLSEEVRKNKTEVSDYLPSALLVGMIALLIVFSFVPNKPAYTNGYICVGLFLIGLVGTVLRKKSIKVFVDTMREIDYITLLLLSGLFVVIAGIEEAGVIDKIGELFVTFSGDNLFVLYTLIVWISVLLSAFIDNIPYVATMLPVVYSAAMKMGVSPEILYFGLLSGATLGGNITPIGASANITAIGILRKNGHEVGLGQYLKISVPATLATVTTGYVLIWFIWR